MGGQLTVVFLVHAISVRVLCKAQYIWLICGSNVELANKSGRHWLHMAWLFSGIAKILVFDKGLGAKSDIKSILHFKCVCKVHGSVWEDIKILNTKPPWFVNILHTYQPFHNECPCAIHLASIWGLWFIILNGFCTFSCYCFVNSIFCQFLLFMALWCRVLHSAWGHKKVLIFQEK